MPEIILHPRAKIAVDPVVIAQFGVEDRVIPDRGAALLVRQAADFRLKKSCRKAFLPCLGSRIRHADCVIAHNEQAQGDYPQYNQHGEKQLTV